MKRYILTFVLSITNILCFADYTDRGRPSDFQESHDGPLTYIFMAIGAIIVLAFIGFWIYDKITSHKKQISDALGTIFAGLLIFGGMLLIGKCGESLHNSINTNDANSEQVNSNVTSDSPNSFNSTNNQQINQSPKPTYTPTLRYRTVEYYENCLNCGGTGKILCPRCNGTGSYKVICSWCNGSGGHSRSRCMYCNGKGYTEDDVFGSGNHNCINCNGTGYMENRCEHCSGTGYESKTCDIYAEFGQSKHMVTCPTCNGSGRIRKTRQESYYE